MGVSEICLAEIGPAEIRPAEGGVSQIRFAEIRTAQVRSDKGRSLELRFSERRTDEVRAAQVRSTQRGATQVHAAEIGPFEIGQDGTEARPPSIPDSYPTPELRQVLRVGHCRLAFNLLSTRGDPDRKTADTYPSLPMGSSCNSEAKLARIVHETP